MHRTRLKLEAPEQATEVLQQEAVRSALAHFASLSNADLTITRTAIKQESHPADSDPADRQAHQVGSTAGLARSDGSWEYPVRYREETKGRVVCQGGDDEDLARSKDTARAIGAIAEGLLDREMAVEDLAEALMATYEEMNLLYALLPNITTKTDPREIGQVLVEETARTLGCKRVSLLVFNERKSAYRVLAGVGLPNDIINMTVPIEDSVTGRAITDKDILLVKDINDHPELAGVSRGEYESNAFAVARVPVQARGESLGFLTATERIEPGEFTARDRKLLECLSSVGASTLMNCQLHAAINKQMMSTIHALASAVDAKDRYTHDHAGRVAQLCVAAATELGVADPETQREVELAGLLHDIGKIGIPDAILSKPADLTPEEYRTIQKHAEIGAGIVRHVPGLEGVSKAILFHHERFDGLGYPRGLRGEAIPLASALISVADAFDALTTDRPYRQAGSIDDALLELQRCRGTQFDPGVVDAFARVIRREVSRLSNTTSADPPAGTSGETSVLLHPRASVVQPAAASGFT